MSGVIKAASVDQYTAVKLWTTADGLPKTNAVYNTAGLSIKYQIGNAAVQSVTVAASPAPASMSAGGAHADWGIYHRGNGWYVIGLADALLATAGSRVTVWIELTGCDSTPTEIYVAGYDGSAVAVGANTTTPLDAAGTRTAIGLGSANLDTQLADLPTVAEFEARTLLAAAYFDPAVDTVARVTLVDTTTANTDMVDVSGLATAANLATVANYLDTEIAAILADTNELQANQGNWLTATGFSTHSAADVLTAFGTGSTLTACSTADVSGLLTAAAYTASLPTNFGDLVINVSGEVTTSNPASGGGSAHTAEDVAALILSTPANKLVTNASGQVEASNMRGTDDALLAASAPANFAALGINASGHVSRVSLTDTTTTNTDMRGTDGANTVAPATPANVTDAQAAILSQGNAAWTTADVSGLATAANLAAVAGYLDTEIAAILNDTSSTIPALIAALNNLSAQQVWEYATRELTAGGDGGGATAQEVWEYATRTLTASGSLSVDQAAQLLAIYNLTNTSGESEMLNAAATAAITGGVVAAISSGGAYPILWPLTDTESDTRELDRRDDYTDADPILIDVATVHDLAAEGVTFSFEAKRGGSTITGTGTLDSTLGENSYRIAVLITSSQTDKTESTYDWKLVAILESGTRHTVRRGCVKLV